MDDLRPALSRPWLRALVGLSLPPLAIVLLTQTAAWWFPGELFSHWSLHAAVCLLPAAVALRRVRWAGPLALLAVLGGAWPWALSSFEARAPAPPSDRPALAVAHANVFYRNPRPADALAAVAARHPDLVSLVEVVPDDRRRLLGDARWPHQAWEFNAPSPDSGEISGAALLSARPFAWSVRHELDGESAIEAAIDLEGVELRVLVVHPKSPTTPARLATRDRQLAQIAGLARARPGPLLVMGDFNLTPGSPVWRAFLDVTGLRRPEGRAPSTWMGGFGPFGLPIDHILVGEGVQLSAVGAWSIPGSDHRGLDARVALPGQGSASPR